MKVFLSSTYNDLIEHRKTAHDALEQLGLHVIWMEAFGARPEESTKACLDEVEESDLFVGIYAHRYGYIPDDSDISITEQEFLHAKTKGKPIFGFVINEDHPWSPKHIEYDKKEKLDTFLGKVKKQPVEFFTTPDNLANNIASSVGHYLSELKPAPDSPPPIYEAPKPTGSTLPNQPYFFGREEELKTIEEALSPESRTWGALIDGPGGIGKTALAIRAAHLAPKVLFDRKIFITAKIRELKPEGEKPLADFTRADYQSILNELALELGEEGIPRLAPDERTNALRLALADKKTIIIFDNLETLHKEERERLYQFLSRLPQGNKSIVTSRRRGNIDARVIRLDRMEPKEALQLINKLAENNTRLAREDENARIGLYEITNGNPLLIKWVCGQLGREGSHLRTISEACKYIEDAPKGNDPLEYIFGDLLETFTESETKVLAALTHFTQPAKVEWIVQMTSLPERTTETALEDLSDRAILIAGDEARDFFLPPLAAQFIRTRRPEAVTQTGDALIDRAYALATQYGGSDNYEGFRVINAEWNLLAAALPRLLLIDNTLLQTACDQLSSFFDFTGRWDDLIRLSGQAEARALAANDKESAGWRAYEMGMTYANLVQPTEVLACATRVAEYWQDSTPRNNAIAIQMRGLGHIMGGDYPAAITAYREALEIDRSISPESDDVANDLNTLADAEHRNGDYSAAERNYREALRIVKINKNEEGEAVCIGNLAMLAYDLEQWTKAESLSREALALSEKVGRQDLIAGDCDLIAESLLKQNKKLKKALSLARRAVEIYTRLRHPDLQGAQETLAEIEVKIKEK